MTRFGLCTFASCLEKWNHAHVPFYVIGVENEFGGAKSKLLIIFFFAMIISLVHNGSQRPQGKEDTVSGTWNPWVSSSKFYHQTSPDYNLKFENYGG